MERSRAKDSRRMRDRDRESQKKTEEIRKST